MGLPIVQGTVPLADDFNLFQPRAHDGANVADYLDSMRPMTALVQLDEYSGTANCVRMIVSENVLFYKRDDNDITSASNPDGSVRVDQLGRRWKRLQGDVTEVVAEIAATVVVVQDQTIAAKKAAEAARDLAQAAATASAVALAAKDTIALGRASVADGMTFWVKPNATDGLSRFSNFLRTSSTTQILIGSLAVGAEIDALTAGKLPAEVSKNLFNSADADVALGQFPNHNTGILQGNVGYNCTGFIPVTAGSTYTFSIKHYVVWYTAAKSLISGTSDADFAKTQTAPAGAAFVRCSAATAQWPTLQVQLGALQTAYEAYGTQYLPPANVLDRSLPGAKLAAGAVTQDKTSFLRPGKNLFNKATTTASFYLGHDNTLTASATFSYSDFIPVTPGETYKPTHALRFTTFFSADKIYIAGGASAASSAAFVIPASVHFVRVTFTTAELDVLQLEAGAASTAFDAYRWQILGPNGERLLLTAEMFGAGAVGTPAIAGQAVTPEKTNFLLPGKNLFNKASVTVGYFQGSDGAPAASATYNTSDFIAVTPGVQYFARAATNTTRMLTYYTAAKAVLAGGSNNNLSTFTPPANAAYVKVSVYAADMDSYQMEVGAAATAYEPFGWRLKLASGVPINLENATAASALQFWTGKAWASLGDSITAGNTWQPIVAAKLGLVHSNFGVGGTRLSGAGNTSMCHDDRLNAIPTTIDVLTLAAGTNDWAQNVALGAMDSTDTATFNGAFNSFAAKAMARWPAKRIIIQTTPYGEIYDFVPRGWANAYTNTLGLTTREYAEALRVQAARWGFPVADVAGRAGWNTLNIRTFINDDGALLHPLAAGGARMAEVHIGAMQAIAPTN